MRYIAPKYRPILWCALSTVTLILLTLALIDRSPSTIAGVVISIFLTIVALVFPKLEDRPDSKLKSELLDEIELPPSARQQHRKSKSKKLRWLWVFGIVTLLIAGAVLTVFLTNQIGKTPLNKITILLADFDGPDPDKYRVTETLWENLNRSLGGYGDVLIKRLGQPIASQTSEDAQKAGIDSDADIVIWGWYGMTSDKVPVSTHFEVVDRQSCVCLPSLLKAGTGAIQMFPVADLNSFSLQTELSNQMNYITLFAVGLVRYRAQDWDAAIQRFTEALNQRIERVSLFDQSVIYFYLGTAYAGKASFTYVYPNDSGNQDNMRYARNSFATAVAVDPKFADAFINLGNTYYFQQDYDQALVYFNKAVELSPTALAYLVRGDAYLFKGDNNEAIANYNQALTLDPSYAIAFSNRGIAHEYAGNMDAAWADFEQAVRIDPKLAQAYYNRGNWYYLQQNYDAAIGEFTKAIELSPSYQPAYSLRGTVYLEKRDTTSALRDLNKAIELKPNAMDYQTRAAAYMASGDLPHAHEDFTHAINLDPKSARSYFGRGWLSANKSSYEDAIVDYGRAIEIDPDFVEAYVSRADAYRTQGNLDKALEDLDHAILIDPEDEHAYLIRGKIYATQDQTTKAISDFRKVLAITSDPALRSAAEDELSRMSDR